MDKKQRMAAIARIIGREKIADQAELKQRLAESGIETSQASLSRDIKALGVRKIRGPKGGWIYALKKSPRRNRKNHFVAALPIRSARSNPQVRSSSCIPHPARPS